jgi:hypothetical protein
MSRTTGGRLIGDLRSRSVANAACVAKRIQILSSFLDQAISKYIAKLLAALSH